MFSKFKKILKSKKAIGSISTAIKVTTACVLGASILMGSFSLIKHVILPSTAAKTQEIIDYQDSGSGDSISGVTRVNQGEIPTYTYSQVNALAQSYLDNVTYNANDYQYSWIGSYTSVSTDYKKSSPVGYTVSLPAGTLTVTDNNNGFSYSKEISSGEYTFYNITPDLGGEFVVTNANDNILQQGHLRPTGSLRMINTLYAQNVRDIGGWACDGGTIKYGKMFRGSAISSADRDVLVNQCGVRHELNLVGGASGASPLGTDIETTQPASMNWYSLVDANESTATWITNLQCAFNCAKNNKPLYFHCQQGADRTGTFTFIIETLLGVSQSDCDKDFEITSFAPKSTNVNETELCIRFRTSGLKDLVNEINALPGSSFKQKVINWVGSLGFTEQEVNDFRRAMINGNPADVHFD